MKIIDSHAHIVQYIAGIGSGGELRSIGGGMARYANGQVVRMIPEQFHTDGVSPEQLLESWMRTEWKNPCSFRETSTVFRIIIPGRL